MQTRLMNTRTWPRPARPWVMAQIWNDLLFAHWSFPADTIRKLIPASLELDTFNGEAWIGVVPFWMSGVRPRWTPPLPWISLFHELNVRTYVVRDGKPGVWFFSLDAANPVAVSVARRLFHLPYQNAKMSSDQQIKYSNNRTDSPKAQLECTYRPIGDVFHAQPDTLENWLTARYCLYATDKRGNVYRGEIDHPAWPLQPAEAQFQVNTMVEPLGLTLPNMQPLLHFSRKLEVVIWGLERC